MKNSFKTMSLIARKYVASPWNNTEARSYFIYINSDSKVTYNAFKVKK